MQKGRAQTAGKPAFGTSGDQWHDEGWLVPVEFQKVPTPFRPKNFINDLKAYLPEKYSPLQSNGNGNQGVYLAEISAQLFNAINEKLGFDAGEFVAQADVINESEAEGEQASIAGRTDIGATQKQQLILARRGQGIFKANVRLNEKACRVTGVTNPGLLIASHIKPWSKSSDREKLDGCNGLLLSPHIDWLFDKGLISFEDNGKMIVSSKLDRNTLRRWSLDHTENVGKFQPAQAAYLAYHREVVFKPD